MTTLAQDDGRDFSALAGSVPPGESTISEDRITLALSAWVIAGMLVDGYAHAYIIDTATEDFFTPWHGLFYAGFTTLAAWIGFIGYRRRRPAVKLIDWFPAAYRPAVVGLGIFAVGGVGDGIWHTVFGVEVGIDALLSPTHLILFVGSLLLLWTPVRASAIRADPSPWLAIGAATLTTSLLVFLIQYLWAVPYPWFAHQFFDPATGAGSGTVEYFLASAMVATAVLIGPLRLISRRWTLPTGSAALIWGTAAALESLAFSQEFWPIVIVATAGLVHDLVLVVTRSWNWSAMAAAFAGPASLFAGYLIMARIEQPLGWPPEIWGGLVVMAGCVGAGLVLIEQAGQTPAVSDPAE